MSAAESLLAADPSAPLEPRYIYKELEKRGRCCGCFPNVVKIIEDVLAAAMVANGEGDRVSILEALRKTAIHPSS